MQSILKINPRQALNRPTAFVWPCTRLLAILLFSIGRAYAAPALPGDLPQNSEPAPPAPPTAPVPATTDATDPSPSEAPPLSVQSLGDNWFQLGDIKFNRESGDIEFPARVNQQEDVLEYLIVHETGKTHEALLNTTVSPTHLHAILLLLRYPMSRDALESFLNRPSPDPLADPWVPPDPSEEELAAFQASRVDFFIRTRPDNGGEPQEFPIFDWVQYTGDHEQKDFLMVFNGSVEVPLGYSAEMSGTVAANFYDRGSMFNLIHPDAWDDTVWLPKPDIVPKIDTAVDVVLRRRPLEPADAATEAAAATTQAPDQP